MSVTAGGIEQGTNNTPARRYSLEISDAIGLPSAEALSLFHAAIESCPREGIPSLIVY
jgi:hypothetical protein